MSFLDGATGNWLIVSWFLFFHPHSGLDHQPNFLKYWNGERSGILILEGAVVAKRPNVRMLTTLTDWLAYKWKLPTPEIELHCSDVCTWPNKLLFAISLNFILWKSWVVLYSVVCLSGIGVTRPILTQYHQVPLIIHNLVRHSSANWIISLFTTHLMSHA